MNSSSNTSRHFLSIIWQYSIHYKSRLLLGLFATVIASITEAVSPLLLKSGIDNLQTGSGIGLLYFFSGLIVLVAAIGGVFRFMMRDLIVGVSRWVESDIRENFFRHLLHLPPIFFDAHHTGDLMARATDDMDRVRMVAGPALLYTINTQLTTVFSIIMMFVLNFKLALLLMFLIPFVGSAMLAVARALHKANLKQQETYGNLSSLVQENLAGIRVVKGFVREDSESKRFYQICKSYFSQSLNVAKLQALMHTLIGFLIGLGIAGILYIGGRQVVSNNISLGSFVAFISYLSILAWPMIALGWVVHLYQRGAASHKRIDYIFNQSEQFPTNSLDEISESVFAKCLIENPTIQYKNVTFRYRNEGPFVLDNLNLVIPARKIVALVGATGSGKSSIARLLTRLYEPQSGVIMIDNVNWSKVDVTVLRKHIAYVEQTPFIFSATIKENILFGNKSALHEDVVSAAHIACLDSEIDDFPDKYDTIIGERGVTLSGGQQQRLALARALITNAPILILDDALSAIDTDTEKMILDRLGSALKLRTTLFITHRLSAAERADVIAVLENSHIIEYGNHEELLELNGVYSRMYRQQRLSDEIKHLTI